jgi:hypothetical protein
MSILKKISARRSAGIASGLPRTRREEKERAEGKKVKTYKVITQ